MRKQLHGIRGIPRCSRGHRVAGPSRHHQLDRRHGHRSAKGGGRGRECDSDQHRHRRSKRIVTDDSGDYQFPNLLAGHYQIAVQRQGFADALSTSIALENGTTRRINVTLSMGQVAETVDVTSAAANVKTDDANVSEVIGNKLIRELPIEGRNFLNYAQIVPGFNSGTGDNSRIAWGLASATNTGAQQLNVGGTEYGVGYYIDGLNNNDNWVEGPVTNVNMDAIQEVKAEVINYSAEYGRDVGQISLTTKSGTNALHGTVYDFFQNSGLNANDPYSISTGLRAPRSTRTSTASPWAARFTFPSCSTASNKLFFFVSAEWIRNRGERQVLAYVPTDAERTGDFSEWLTRFPVGNPAQCDGTDTSPGQLSVPDLRSQHIQHFHKDPHALPQQRHHQSGSDRAGLPFTLPRAQLHFPNQYLFLQLVGHEHFRDRQQQLLRARRLHVNEPR